MVGFNPKVMLQPDADEFWCWAITCLQFFPRDFNEGMGTIKNGNCLVQFGGHLQKFMRVGNHFILAARSYIGLLSVSLYPPHPVATFAMAGRKKILLSAVHPKSPHMAE